MRLFFKDENNGIKKNMDIKFHLGEASCMDINDRYLVSGSCDGSCIIWKLPDFNPMYCLIIPVERSLIIKDVALYNDYIML